jgi:tetratricopeptide (TPR) repeat protein
MSWTQISGLAATVGNKLEPLTAQVSLRLNEEEVKTGQTGIDIDFEDLGLRILGFAAAAIPDVGWDQRWRMLEERATELLGSRHKLLSAARKTLERIQALVIRNNSAAWAELAGILRRDLSKPGWGLEAADVALEKDPLNVAALTVKIAANGDLGRFAAAHLEFDRVMRLDSTNHFAKAAISKVEILEGALQPALNHALNGFRSDPKAGTARLVGNIYKKLEMYKIANHWYWGAERIEGPESDEITKAHAEGLLALAKKTLDESAGK